MAYSILKLQQKDLTYALHQPVELKAKSGQLKNLFAGFLR